MHFEKLLSTQPATDLEEFGSGIIFRSDNGLNIAASQSFIFHSVIFFFLLCHFGEGEKNLTCKGPLREFEFDENKLLSVEELEPIGLGILLPFLNFFLFCGASTIRFFCIFKLGFLFSWLLITRPVAKEVTRVSGKLPLFC